MKVLDPRTPNFFILGAAKSGTTTLYTYLVQHPEIYMPKEKEPHYFDDDEIFSLGINNYLSTHFEYASNYNVRGEATPAYFRRMEKVIYRLKKIYGNKEPQFILIFRNPVERAWSHYLHMRRIGSETKSFEKALELECERMKAHPDAWFGYFSDGLYGKQLEVWLEFFPKKQFLYLLTSDLYDNLNGTLKNVFKFLGVEDISEAGIMKDRKNENSASEARNKYLTNFLANPPSQLKGIAKKLINKQMRRSIVYSLHQINLRTYSSKPKMVPATEKMLYEKYLSDICSLEELIERDLTIWKAGSNRE